MNISRSLIARRKAIHLVLALAGGALLRPSAFALEAKDRLIETPENVLGPFYPVIRPLEKDADLTKIRGRKEQAAGQIVHLTGRVLNLRGEPVPGARLELWQANTHGRYAHPADQNSAPLDPNFQGYSLQKTDREGRYRFKTIKPGAYPVGAQATRPPHLHFEIRSRQSRLVTQMYFPGEPLNEQDVLFNLLGEAAKAATGTIYSPASSMERDSIAVQWNIVLSEG